MGFSRTSSSRGSDERGAALIEFALILPVFMMMVLGMFTGGLAYNQKISLTNAAREASRYGATLPVTPDLEAWLRLVAGNVISSATGDLSDTVPGRHICVAYVYPAGEFESPIIDDDRTKSIIVSAGDPPAAGSIVNGACKRADGSAVDDGYGTDVTSNGQRRVVVHVSRPAELEFLLGNVPLTLEATSVTRFEAS